MVPEVYFRLRLKNGAVNTATSQESAFGMARSTRKKFQDLKNALMTAPTLRAPILGFCLVHLF